MQSGWKSKCCPDKEVDNDIPQMHCENWEQSAMVVHGRQEDHGAYDGITVKCTKKCMSVGTPTFENEQVTSGVYEEVHNHLRHTCTASMSNECAMYVATST